MNRQPWLAKVKFRVPFCTLSRKKAFLFVFILRLFLEDMSSQKQLITIEGEVVVSTNSIIITLCCSSNAISLASRGHIENNKAEPNAIFLGLQTTGHWSVAVTEMSACRRLLCYSLTLISTMRVSSNNESTDRPQLINRKHGVGNNIGVSTLVRRK